MRKVMFVLFCVALSLFVVPPANATSFTLASINVDLHNADPGLVLYWNPIQGVPVTFNLNNVGDTWGGNLFKIGTTEDSVTWFEDTVHYPIKASFNFSAPAINFQDTGQSWGTILDYGRVVWSDPVSIAFGNGGLLQLNLQDVTFGTPGEANVSGTFRLVSLSNGSNGVSVPESSTLLLLGGGLLGLVGYGRSRRMLKK